MLIGLAAVTMIVCIGRSTVCAIKPCEASRLRLQVCQHHREGLCFEMTKTENMQFLRRDNSASKTDVCLPHA
uniref:Putative secreted protein n=1 Tax=Anopheles marajoara TaxID=58244 RepID=A0A2M4CEH4_9DIPT